MSHDARTARPSHPAVSCGPSGPSGRAGAQPGRCSLTAGLPATSTRDDAAAVSDDRGLAFLAAAVQRRGEGHVHRRQLDEALGFLDAPAVAARGVAGADAPLPHLDTIQASFGHHDVSGVRTRTGGAAADASAALGARAYATGDRVGFATAPELHTAAHEAAHVVQQRGGAALAGGLGQAGDPYEQHADRVADAVVRGDSAEALLDEHADGSGSAALVQREAEVGGPEIADAARTAAAPSDAEDPAPSGEARITRAGTRGQLLLTHFGKDDAVLRTNHLTALNDLVRLLDGSNWGEAWPDHVSGIGGSASPEGPAEHNQRLSKLRADSVATKLGESAAADRRAGLAQRAHGLGEMGSEGDPSKYPMWRGAIVMFDLQPRSRASEPTPDAQIGETDPDEIELSVVRDPDWTELTTHHLIWRARHLLDGKLANCVLELAMSTKSFATTLRPGGAWSQYLNRILANLWIEGIKTIRREAPDRAKADPGFGYHDPVGLLDASGELTEGLQRALDRAANQNLPAWPEPEDYDDAAAELVRAAENVAASIRAGREAVSDQLQFKSGIGVLPDYLQRVRSWVDTRDKDPGHVNSCVVK